ncbi:hypothetical protein GGS20DRAFT_465075 [Poronia punctata]|nr:hypothetical protein GGS20DRAFT_465075 [Poronia punctata]
MAAIDVNTEKTSSNVDAVVAGQAPMSPNPLDDLFDAVVAEDQEKMRRILNNDPSLLNSQNIQGGKFENMSTRDILHQLQSRKEQSNNQQPQNFQVEGCGNQCPLHVACIFGKLEAVKVLLSYDDTDINATNGSGETPFGVACRAAHLNIAQSILEHSYELSSNGKTVRLEYEGDEEDHSHTPPSYGKKPDLHHEDDEGHTPIHYLGGRGIDPVWEKGQEPSEESLELLLRTMFLFSDEDFRRSSMMIVCYSGSVDLLKVILKFDKKAMNLRDTEGWTALHWAICSSHTETVEALLDAGAKITQPTTFPPSSNAEEFAAIHGEEDIASLIAKSNSTRETEKFLKAWLWPMKTINPVVNDAREQMIEECQVTQLIETLESLRSTSHKSQPTWCHFPANNWDWLKRLYVERSTKKFLYKIFGSSRGPPPFCYRKYSDPTLGGTDSKEGNPVEDKSKRDPHVSVTVLPVIDIDMLNLDKFTNAMTEGKDEDTGFHHPRTLDHYRHTDLHPRRLDELNNNQVLTRYIGSLSNQPRRRNDPSPLPESDQNSMKNNLGTKFQLLWTIPRTPLHRAPEPTDLEVGLSPLQSEAQAGDSKEQDSKGSSKRILVVSQLWLIYTNNSLVSLFPQRGDIKSNDGGQQVPERAPPLQESSAQTGPAIEQGRELPYDIRNSFKGTKVMKKAYHDMVNTSMIYRSTVKINGKSYTYLEIFAKEVLRVSRKIDKCFDRFLECLGTSDRNFRELSKDVTGCLLAINDVVDEIEIISEVLGHQHVVWDQMHKSPPDDPKNQRVPSAETCSWGHSDCNSDEAEASSRSAEKVTAHAKNVQEKAKGLMELLQGQAGTENAIKASEQARYLAIFTVLSVIFTPLSFVTSLLALQIESFTPQKWSMAQVAMGTFFGFLITLVGCLIWFLVMKHDLSKLASGPKHEIKKKHSAMKKKLA